MHLKRVCVPVVAGVCVCVCLAEMFVDLIMNMCLYLCVCMCLCGCVSYAGSLRGSSALMCGCSDAELVLSRQPASCVNTHAFSDTHTQMICLLCCIFIFILHFT